MTWLFIKMRMLNHRKQYFTQFLRPLDGVQDGSVTLGLRRRGWHGTSTLYTLSSAAVILIFLMPWLGAATASQTQGRFCPSSGLLAASLVYPQYPGPHSTIDCNLATNQTKLYSHTPPLLVPYAPLLANWRPHFFITPGPHTTICAFCYGWPCHPPTRPPWLAPEMPWTRTASGQTTDNRWETLWI